MIIYCEIIQFIFKVSADLFIFQSDIEDSELTSQRQGILNHLLVMLNTAVNEGEQKKKDGYLHGSLGLVPDGQQ